MTLEEAKAILQQYRRDGEPHDLQDFEDAIDLGIEAIDRVQKYRPLYAGKYAHLLPGETE